MDPFQQAAENFEASQAGNEGGSSQENSQSSSDHAPALRSVESAPQSQQSQAEQAVLDLSKHDKFTIAGREFTREQMQKLIDDEKKFQSMNKDYTQKTQRLSEERKALESDQKFYQNLPHDLLALRADPSRINEFLQIYPQKFHSYAENILKQASAQVQSGQNPNQAPQAQGPSVEILSRLQQVENFLNEHKTKERETVIGGFLSELDKAYPDAADFREMILGRAFEAHNNGQIDLLQKEAWENIYKQVDQDVAQKLKAKYGNLVKQQTEANKKARDVSAGGGAVGRAPQKFKKWADIDKAAMAAIDNG